MGQFPYQVSLRSTQNSHFCGGFIISNRWIGSAGKTFQRFYIFYLLTNLTFILSLPIYKSYFFFDLFNSYISILAHCTAPRTVGNTRAVVGAIHRSTGGVTHNLARLINHPNYQASTLANDVSLIQTASQIVFNNMASPVPLASHFVGGGVNAVATGFGQVTLGTSNF